MLRGMAASAVGLRRLVSQSIVASARCDRPADVVGRLGAMQAQDYSQSLWAFGARLRSGTVAGVEHAIAERRILRSWLIRGTIHFALPEDVRWLLALCAPRLAAADARRHAQLGLTEAQIDRCAELASDALAGDRRLSRAEAMRLFDEAGIETTGQRGYHILVRLARNALICLGPMQGKQQTIVLLDDWAPRGASRDLPREAALSELASRFATSRGPVTTQDFARWAGVPVTEAEQGLRAAAGLAARSLDGIGYWLAADQARPPSAVRGAPADLPPGRVRRVLPRLQGSCRDEKNGRERRRGEPRYKGDLSDSDNEQWITQYQNYSQSADDPIPF